MSDILADRTEIVPIDSVKGYDKNPRIGDVGAIADSLRENSQYRPIVVQRSTNKILAGNHTWMAAKSLGWDEIAVVFIDVDDDQAKKIVLADNRTNDLASYDARQLAELLEELPEIEGTGYTDQDLEVLLDQLETGGADADDLIDDIIHPASVKTVTREEEEIDDLEDQATQGGSVGGVNRPNFANDEDIRRVDDEIDDEERLEELRFEFEAYEMEIWPSTSVYGIPRLSSKRLVEELPSNLDTWVGASRHTPEEIEDPTKNWIYNYSVGTRDVPYSRSIMGFYVHDEKFENWWHLPSYYVAKFAAAGIERSAVPDYSMRGDWPRALNIYNTYRSYWLGRYFQQCGWRVIPNLEWAGEGAETFIFDGVPPNPPVAIKQLQTLRSLNKTPEEDLKFHRDGIRYALEIVKPQALIIYTGEPGMELMDSMLKRSKYKPDEVVYVSSFSARLKKMGVFERERPKGTKRSVTGQKPGKSEEDEEIDDDADTTSPDE